MLLIPLLAIQAKSFPEIFSTFQIAFLRKEKYGCKSGYKKMWCRSDIKEMQQVVPLITRETAFC